MSILLTLGQLVDSAEALSRLAALKLKPRIALRVKRMLRAAQLELDDFNKTRIPLAEQYGHKSADGTKYEFATPEAGQVFTDALADVRQEEITLEAATLMLEDLERTLRCEKCGHTMHDEGEISGGDLLVLDWLILEEPEKAE